MFDFFVMLSAIIIAQGLIIAGLTYLLIKVGVLPGKEILPSIRLMPARFRKDDPVYNCALYKDKGCSHVDGFLCNMPTCTMLKEYEDN